MTGKKTHKTALMGAIGAAALTAGFALSVSAQDKGEDYYETRQGTGPTEAAAIAKAKAKACNPANAGGYITVVEKTDCTQKDDGPFVCTVSLKCKFNP